MRTLCLALFATLTLASRCEASGLDLAWDRCWSDGGTIMHHFACDVDTAGPVGTLVASFAPSSDMPLFAWFEAVVDLLPHSATLPDWWQFFNPMCISLSQIVVHGTDGTQESIQIPLHNQLVGWQCGEGTIGCPPIVTCWFRTVVSCDAPATPCATPARAQTWGAIKNLYR